MFNIMKLPRYKCHKVVRAGKVTGILRHHSQNDDVDISLALADGTNHAVRVDEAWVERHNPQIGGYFVVYDDGYQSFSPKEAFLDGYTYLGQ